MLRNSKYEVFLRSLVFIRLAWKSYAAVGTDLISEICEEKFKDLV